MQELTEVCDDTFSFSAVGLGATWAFIVGFVVVIVAMHF